MTVSVLSAFPSLDLRNGLAYLPFMTFTTPMSQVLLYMGCLSVNLSLPHTTSNLLTGTKVYGYNVVSHTVGSVQMTAGDKLHNQVL